MGHFNSDSNTVGNGCESWRIGSVQDFSRTSWAIDYGLDVGGFDVILYFYNSRTNTVTGEIWWKDIAAPGLPGATGTLGGALGDGVLADYIFIEEFRRETVLLEPYEDYVEKFNKATEEL